MSEEEDNKKEEIREAFNEMLKEQQEHTREVSKEESKKGSDEEEKAKDLIRKRGMIVWKSTEEMEKYSKYVPRVNGLVEKSKLEEWLKS